VDLHLYWGSQQTTGNVAFLIAFGCLPTSAANANIFNGAIFSSYQTLNGAPPGTGISVMATLTGLTVPAGCNSTDQFLLRVAHQQGANGDTIGAADQVYLVGEQVLWN